MEVSAAGLHAIWVAWFSRVTSRWIMDRLNIFNLNSIRKVTEEKMMLRRWAVHEHFIYGAYLRMYISKDVHCTTYDCTILNTTPLGGLVVPFGVYELWPTFGSVLLTFLTHTSFPEQVLKTTGPITVILHIHDLSRSLVMPFQVFGPWPWSWPTTLT